MMRADLKIVGVGAQIWYFYIPLGGDDILADAFVSKYGYAAAR